MKDMQHQKDMLAARKISGKYKYSTGEEFTYTGTYERRFLEYLDGIVHFPASDIMAPAPQLFTYMDEGQERVHIPDFYISSLNLIVNVKSADNKFYRLRDIEVEQAQDAAVKQSDYNYIKIYDNNFSNFAKGIEEIKANLEAKNKKKVIYEADEIDMADGILLEALL